MNTLGNNYGIYVNGTGLLAESYSIAQTNFLVNNYFLGATASNKTTPQGAVKTELNINYLMNLTGNPIYHIINLLKTVPSGIPAFINFGGATGNFYPTSHSFKIGPESSVFASTSFTNFDNTTGSFTGYPFQYVRTIDSDMSSFCSAYLAGETNPLPNIYAIDYQCQINWKPHYKLGRKTSYDVSYISMTETFNIETDEYNTIQFYGSNLDNIISGYDYLYLSGIQPSPNVLFYDLQGGIVTNVSTNISNGALIRNRYTINKYY